MREYRGRLLKEVCEEEPFVYGYIDEGLSSMKIKDFSGKIHEVNPKTVGQFTGLYDKADVSELSVNELKMYRKEELSKYKWKGRKIYEGDIIVTKEYNRMMMAVHYDIGDLSYKAFEFIDFEDYEIQSIGHRFWYDTLKRTTIDGEYIQFRLWGNYYRENIKGIWSAYVFKGENIMKS